MAKRSAFRGDPARNLILKKQDEASARFEDYEPDVEELRQIMQRAFPKTAGLARWAAQMGCAPELLQAVLDGLEPPQGGMLDILGMEWLSERGVYSDPFYSREARAAREVRWAAGLSCSGRIERGSIRGTPLQNLFAVGVAAPKPREEK